jgi:hypothetical protein
MPIAKAIAAASIILSFLYSPLTDKAKQGHSPLADIDFNALIPKNPNMQVALPRGLEPLFSP